MPLWFQPFIARWVAPWWVAFVLGLAGVCVAQPGRLVFSVSGYSISLSSPGGELYVQRVALDGSPLPGPLPEIVVNLSSDSPGGQFSSSNSYFASWSTTFTVALGANESTSPSFYYRDNVHGTTVIRAQEAGLVEGTLNAVVSPTSIADDFESGQLTLWPQLIGSAGITIGVSPLAAHRGGQGFRVDDTNATPGTTLDAGGLSKLMQPTQGDLFLRQWVRVVPTNTLGRVSLGVIFDGMSLLLNNGANQLSAGGTSNGGWINGPDAGGLSPGWHLVEIDVTGMGSPAAAWRFWVDGVERYTQAGIDTTGLSFNSARVGQPYADEMDFTGVIDVDDVRLGALPHASRLTVQPAQGRPGDCIPLNVQLETSAGSPAPAPYNVQFSITSGAALFSDSSCVLPVTTPALAPETSAATLWAKSSVSGVFATSVSHLDFLSTSSSLTVSDTPGGSSGSGGSDPAFRLFNVGCSCNATPSGFQMGTWLLAAGLLLGRARRYGPW